MPAGNMVTTQELIVGWLIVLVLFATGAWMIARRRRSEHLRRRFGPEYERAVLNEGDRVRAEAVLDTREKRVERLHIRPLGTADRDRFARAWSAVQARFVDDPGGAVTEADRLVAEAMRRRGYPVSEADVEQRVEYISVDHPSLVENYRAAAQIARDYERGDASTEELRRAMVYYRALFDDLLEMHQARR
jgi:hypothetical protein